MMINASTTTGIRPSSGDDARSSAPAPAPVLASPMRALTAIPTPVQVSRTMTAMLTPTASAPGATPAASAPAKTSLLSLMSMQGDQGQPSVTITPAVMTPVYEAAPSLTSADTAAATPGAAPGVAAQAKAYFEKAKAWVAANKVPAAVGGVATIGLVAFLISRAREFSNPLSRSQALILAENIGEAMAHSTGQNRAEHDKWGAQYCDLLDAMGPQHHAALDAAWRKGFDRGAKSAHAKNLRNMEAQRKAAQAPPGRGLFGSSVPVRGGPGIASGRPANEQKLLAVLEQAWSDYHQFMERGMRADAERTLQAIRKTVAVMQSVGLGQEAAEIEWNAATTAQKRRRMGFN